MSETTQHRLDGLEPDNLLAFLALLGLLRALDTARRDWRARAFWDVETRPLRPVLVLLEPQTQEAVAHAATEGAASLAAAHEFDRNGLNYKKGEARELLLSADPASEIVLACLMSDGAADEDGKVRSTPLCLLRGQGHQHFLERFSAV